LLPPVPAVTIAITGTGDQLLNANSDMILITAQATYNVGTRGDGLRGVRGWGTGNRQWAVPAERNIRPGNGTPLQALTHIAVDLDADTGQYGQRVITACRDRYLCGLTVQALV
jgi:hypothetical protein